MSGQDPYPGQQYGQQQYGQPYGQAGQPYQQGGPAKTNTMAILALVFAFLVAPLGVIFGFVARSQIKRTGESGSGLALAGIIVGLVVVAFSVLVIGLIALAALAAPAVTDQLPVPTPVPAF